jgi:hypothetical protein
MVRKGKALKATLVAIPLVLCLALLLTGLSPAQEEEEPTINEKYIVTVNDIGDGHIVDTIEYNEKDFEAIKKVENKNRGFLTRRFTTDDNTGEVVDFNTDLDDANHSVVITYDKPGYAYSQKGEFVVYGFSEKPKDDSGGEFKFEEKSTINSEFTLFTDQVILSKTTLELPKASRNAHYDQEDKAIKYQMPSARTQLGFWSENKTLLSVIFGLCTLAFAGMLVLVATRKTLAASEVASSPPVPGKGEAPRFCRKCGRRLASGKQFCTNCGTHV